ncbi:MAG: acetate uptake transporter [Streptosporangiaceae bacterium]
MSTVEERPAVAAAVKIADPGPLGLAAFALTTFLLSADNAGWVRGVGLEWLPYALVYGGIAQVLAGMWEFRNGNVFGATAFTTYGAFWMGLYFYVRQIAIVPKANVPNDLGWVLLAFAIFTLYMLIASSQTNIALFGVFVLLEIAFIVLFIGNFSANTNTIKFGGYVGIATAVVAWYASFAALLGGMGGALKLPVGKPLVRARA